MDYWREGMVGGNQAGASARWGEPLTKHSSLYAAALVIASNTGSAAATLPEKVPHVELKSLINTSFNGKPKATVLLV